MEEEIIIDLINSLQLANEGTMRKRGTGIRQPIDFSNKLFLISEKREVYFELKRSAIFNPLVGQLNDRPIIHRESFTEALTIEIFPAFWKLLLTNLERISFFEAKKFLINYFSQSLPQHITHICVNVSKNEAFVMRDFENPDELFYLNHQDIQNLFLPTSWEEFCYRRLERDSNDDSIYFLIGLPRPENSALYIGHPINRVRRSFVGSLDQYGRIVDYQKSHISVIPNFSELFIRQEDSFSYNSLISNCETENLSPWRPIKRESHYSVAILASAPLFNHLPNDPYPVNIS
jgi:hypothetical protein